MLQSIMKSQISPELDLNQYFWFSELFLKIILKVGMNIFTALLNTTENNLKAYEPVAEPATLNRWHEWAECEILNPPASEREGQEGLHTHQIHFSTNVGERASEETNLEKIPF